MQSAVVVIVISVFSYIEMCFLGGGLKKFFRYDVWKIKIESQRSLFN